ncbi:MAG: mandelate racemase/muconate lactonizing enzyme family protein [Proteiniphilum sp.]
MKITKLDFRYYSRKHEVPITNGKYKYLSNDMVLCQAFTDEGISGFGWVTGNEMAFAAGKRIESYVLGEDPLNTERIWEKLYLPKVFGRKGPAIKAISAVDIALWDLKGKLLGVPLYKLLGGYRDRVPVYVAGGYYETGKSNTKLREEMEANIEKGVKVVKMKIGAIPIREDLKRIEEVKKVLGDKAELMVDANNAYSRIDALKMGYELDKIGGIYWFEEPVSCDDLEGTAILVDKIRTPIAIGENEYTSFGFRSIIESKAASVLNADAQVLGGITEWKKVANTAAAFNLQIAPHGSQEIHVHLVASVSNGLIVEYYDSNTNALRDRMFKNKLTLNADGTVSPYESPGLGIELDLEGIDEFRVL